MVGANAAETKLQFSPAGLGDMSLINDGQKLVVLLALRATLPAQQALGGWMISAMPCRRLSRSAGSATGFSQRENHHHYLSTVRFQPPAGELCQVIGKLSYISKLMTQ